MHAAEMEEVRQREANLTALAAIGPRKKRKIDPGDPVGVSPTNEPPCGKINNEVSEQV